LTCSRSQPNHVFKALKIAGLLRRWQGHIFPLGQRTQINETGLGNRRRQLHCLGNGHIAIDALKPAILTEKHRKPARLHLAGCTILKAVNVVPALLVKDIGNQWRPQNKTHLIARLAGFQLADHFLIQDVALLDIDLIFGNDLRYVRAGGHQGTQYDDRRKTGFSTEHGATRSFSISFEAVYHNRSHAHCRHQPFSEIKKMSDPQSLKNMGLKATLPRLKILELFEKSAQRHLTAEDVYRMLIADHMDIGLATVYRVLTQFEQAGLLERHFFESGKAIFEINRGSHHDHLVCIECGRVEEFYDAEIERRQNLIASERGFTIQDHALHLYAQCIKPDCTHRQKKPQ
jgi:Fur family transcriptional regulator, ferric uptake regulator